MRKGLAVSAGAHGVLAALVVGWALLHRPAPPDTPPQVDILLGGGGTPAPPAAAPQPPPRTPAKPAPKATPKPPRPAAAGPPAAPPPTPATAQSPATPPPPTKPPTPVKSGETGPMASLRDPQHDILHPATAETGNPPPLYPAESVRLKEHGLVTLRLHVTAEGTVSAAEVAISSGSPRLDQAAVAGMSAWHFRPALRDGRPVPDVIELSAAFNLK
jgi:protein TonB